jgi:hypothetical protein
MSRSYHSHLETLYSEVLDLTRSGVITGITLTKLSILTISPSKDSTLSGEAKRVLPATGNLGDLNL